MWVVQAPAMVEGKYPTAFPLKHQQKDMRLALEEASEASLKLPVAAAANNLYMEVHVLPPHHMGSLARNETFFPRTHDLGARHCCLRFAGASKGTWRR